MTLIDQLRQELQQAKTKRDDYLPNWQRNVSERRGKDFDTAADEGRSMVPVDWTLTKTKAAQLFSQMPQIRLTPKHQSYAAAVPVFAKIVNDLMTEANVEAVMSECVVDCVNASGIGACVVRYEALTEPVPVAAVDPITQSMMAVGAPPMPPAGGAPMGAGAPPAPPMPPGPAMDAPAPLGGPMPPAPPMPPAGPMDAAAPDSPAEDAAEGASDSAAEDAAEASAQATSTRITDSRFVVDRISPSDLLWPASFRLSDWNKSPWLGHTARGPWPRVKRLLGLSDDMKDTVVGATRKTPGTVANVMNSDQTLQQEEVVEYDEVFYWRYLYHEDEKYYDAIQRVVFVAGIDDPVINEPWKGQSFDDQNGGYVGACLLPVRILTLAYISDEAVPPSDSAIIRPQVKELQEARQHMKDQRKHSRPLRWFDVDRVDASMTADLIAGTWQGMIPTIGAGDKVIGEVARTAYPRENLEFDRILKQDIQEAVSVGPNQTGTFASGERSASEAQIVQQSFQTEIGQQRAKVAAFSVGIAEVLAGLFVLFGRIDPVGIGAAIGPDGAQRLATWDMKRINQKFVFDVRADSTVRVDAQQLVQQITSALNVTAQSGFINPKPLIERILELNGVDPADVMVDPQPKGPEPPKISYSFKAEDLANPVVMALVLDSGLTPDKVQAAKQVLATMMNPPEPPGAGPGPGGPPPGPGGPPPPPMPPGHSGPPAPPREPHVPDKTFPNWESAPRINTRRAEG